jgi:putative iron-regulated protein
MMRRMTRALPSALPSVLPLAAALFAPVALAQAPATVPLVLGQYAAIVHATYEDALNGARTLKDTVASFVAQPSARGLDAARKAWLQAREAYGQSEAFRFYGGPIDDAQGPEGRINAWPMDESHVDGIQGKAQSGLVNNRKIALTKKTLVAQNERGGEENVATGWHAIEFLLWGQDLDDAGPGRRGFEDFVDGKAPNADRRRQYLSVATDLLVDDLASLVQAWSPQTNNYRARFERGGTESLRKMFVGLGSLSRGELAGERLEVALASQDQEDEHSCFSDNTHRDVVANAVGIENVWLGRYRRADAKALQGPSLRDLVAAKDADLAERVSTQIAASVAAANALQAPFDREIVGADGAPGRQRVRALIDSLVRQSQDLVAAANALGLTKLTLAQPK